MEEPKQGKYGLWYLSGVDHGFSSKEHAEQYLREKAEEEAFRHAVETMPTAKPDGDGKFLGYGKFEWVVAVIVVLVFMFLARGCVGSNDGTGAAERAAERAEERCLDSIGAWVMSQRYVKNNLKSPSSAKFATLPNAAEHISECTHVVVGEFEAQNGFGVMVKQRFSVTMTYDKDTDTWSGSDLHIQNN